MVAGKNHLVSSPGVAPLTWVLGRPASPVLPWTRTWASSLPTQAFALVGAAPSPPAHSPPGRRPPWLLLGPLGWSRGGCYSSPTVSLSFRFADRRFPTPPNRTTPTPQTEQLQHLKSGLSRLSPGLRMYPLSDGNPPIQRQVKCGLSNNSHALSPYSANSSAFRS